MQFSQYWLGNKVNIVMNYFCLGTRSVLVRYAAELKLGDIINTEENLNVR